MTDLSDLYGGGPHTITSHSDVTDATGAELEELTGGGDTTLHDHDGISENTSARHTQGTDTTLGTLAADIDMNSLYQIVNLQAPAANGEALRQTTNITEADLETLTDGSNADLLHAHAAGGGDMLASTYDPTTIADDAFDMDNMVEGTTTKILTDTERTGISANTSARHTQGSDTTLGTMTADINMNSLYQITNLQAPDTAGDALRQTTNITEADLEQLTDGSDTTLHDHDGISENTTHRGSSANPHTVTKTQVSLENVEDLKVNLVATAAPSAATDDVTLGYSVGSRWFDITNDKEYVCLDNTDTAAVWIETTVTTGGSHTITSHSDVVDATGAQLEELTGGGDTSLHDHDGISENTSARHTQGTDTTLGTMAADINMNSLYQVVGLQAPDTAGDAIRQTTNITETNLEALTGGGDTALHDHDGISENTSARHDESHTVVSHSDTTATGAELDTLTDNSVADLLHRHSELVASDGTPDPAFSIDATGLASFPAGTGINEFSIDDTLAGDSDDAVPTEQAVKAYVDINPYAILTVNSTYVGRVMTVTVDDASAVFGNALYCAADFHYERCDANATATMPCRCLALESGAGSVSVLVEGQICNTAWTWVNGDIYISGTTGALTQTAPAVTGDQVQRVGFALSADTIMFQPDSTVIKIS